MRAPCSLWKATFPTPETLYFSSLPISMSIWRYFSSKVLNKLFLLVMWKESPLSRNQPLPTRDETMHVKSVKSNSNCEARASSSDPSKDPFLDFFSGQFVTEWPTSWQWKHHTFNFSNFFPPWEELKLEWESFSSPFFALLAKAQFYLSSMDEEPSLVLLLISSYIRFDQSHSQFGSFSLPLTEYW